jgi:hypothetical protein
MTWIQRNRRVRGVREANGPKNTETNIFFRANIELNSNIAKFVFKTTLGRVSSYA